MKSDLAPARYLLRPSPMILQSLAIGVTRSRQNLISRSDGFTSEVVDHIRRAMHYQISSTCTFHCIVRRRVPPNVVRLCQKKSYLLYYTENLYIIKIERILGRILAYQYDGSTIRVFSVGSLGVLCVLCNPA